MNNYPYTNTHELNLDWILQQMKEFHDQYSNIQQAMDDAITAIAEKEEWSVEQLLAQKASIEANLQLVESQLAQALTQTGSTELTALQEAVSAFDAHANTLVSQMPADLAALTQNVLILAKLMTYDGSQTLTWFVGDYVGGSKNTYETNSDASCNMIIGGAGMQFTISIAPNVDSDTKLYVLRWFEGKGETEGTYIGEHIISLGNARSYTGVIPANAYCFSITLRNSVTLFNSNPASSVCTFKWLSPLTNDVQMMKYNLLSFNGYNLLDDYPHNNSISAGVTFTWDGVGNCDVSGEATSTSYGFIYNNTSALPTNIKPGHAYNIIYSAQSTALVVYATFSDSTGTTLANLKTNGTFVIPENAAGLLIYLRVNNEVTVNETVHPIILDYEMNMENKPTNYLYWERYSDANDISEDCRIFNSSVEGSLHINNTPLYPGELVTIPGNPAGTIITQIYYPYDSDYQPVMIRTNKLGEWGVWHSITDKGYIDAVDSAGGSESDKTDMRTVIQAMLNRYGYAKLGPGAFYISGYIDMPEGSTLEGCGDSTTLFLKQGNNKVAIYLRAYCSVKNMNVYGNATDLVESDFSSTAGNRFGIHFYKGSNYGYDVKSCVIDNVHIKNFTGSGIYCSGTGGGVDDGVLVNNVKIENCWCGLNSAVRSEFCRFNNMQMTHCYIACINNSGNNMFNNCVFHGYAIGMKIDGSQQNSGHGCCSNSSFCHSGNNAGLALDLGNIWNGFVFNACQFWYNDITIDTCKGILFTGCEFGRNTNTGIVFTINGGDTVLISGSIFQNDNTRPPVFNITNNTKVHVVGCYGGMTGNEITIS